MHWIFGGAEQSQFLLVNSSWESCTDFFGQWGFGLTVRKILWLPVTWYLGHNLTEFTSVILIQRTKIKCLAMKVIQRQSAATEKRGRPSGSPGPMCRQCGCPSQLQISGFGVGGTPSCFRGWRTIPLPFGTAHVKSGNAHLLGLQSHLLEMYRCFSVFLWMKKY